MKTVYYFHIDRTPAREYDIWVSSKEYFEQHGKLNEDGAPEEVSEALEEVGICEITPSCFQADGVISKKRLIDLILEAGLEENKAFSKMVLNSLSSAE